MLPVSPSQQWDLGRRNQHPWSPPPRVWPLTPVSPPWHRGLGSPAPRQAAARARGFREAEMPLPPFPHAPPSSCSCLPKGGSTLWPELPPPSRPVFGAVEPENLTMPRLETPPTVPGGGWGEHLREAPRTVPRTSVSLAGGPGGAQPPGTGAGSQAEQSSDSGSPRPCCKSQPPPDARETRGKKVPVLPQPQTWHTHPSWGHRSVRTGVSQRRAGREANAGSWQLLPPWSRSLL